MLLKVSVTENNQKAQEKIVVLNLILFKDRLFLLQSPLPNAEYLCIGEKWAVTGKQLNCLVLMRFVAVVVSELTAYYQEMLVKNSTVNGIGTCW